MSLECHRVPVAHGGELFVRSVGAGRPVVFVPGWTFGNDVFAKQVDGLADLGRIVTYDPRGTGRSPATLLGNTYLQHGQDLGAILDALDLQDVVLVSWSYGSNTAYAYLRACGFDRIHALMVLDESPRPMTDADHQWGEGSASELSAYLAMLRDGHRGFMDAYVPTMVSRSLSRDEHETILASSEGTAPFVAWSLFADGALADWREEAKAAAIRIPTWTVVREDQAEAARAWLAANARETKLDVYPSHMMFWEFPERFNEDLRRFVEALPA